MIIVKRQWQQTFIISLQFTVVVGGDSGSYEHNSPSNSYPKQAWYIFCDIW